MAACLITVTGTSGIIKIDYKISAVDYSIQTSIGSFYIDDTATDVTYTTVTGDLVAASGCLTITEIPANYYEIVWKDISATGYIANAIFLGYDIGGEITITDTLFPDGKYAIADSINNAGDDRVKVIGFKTTGFNSAYPGFTASYILKVLGTERPDLRVRNADNTSFIFIHGESTSSTLPVEYTAIEPCYSTIITTTTIFAP